MGDERSSNFRAIVHSHLLECMDRLLNVAYYLIHFIYKWKYKNVGYKTYYI